MSTELPTKIFLVRHGETEWNVRGVLQGQNDAPLTPRGLRQALAISKTFESVNVDAIFSSDLGRAYNTAIIIARPHQQSVHVHTLLRERSFGKYEGKRARDVLVELHGKLRKAQSLSNSERLNYRISKEIETDQEVVDRFYGFVREAMPNYPAKTVLVVSHGGLMRSLLIHLKFANHYELSRSSIDNLGYIELEYANHILSIKETHGIHKHIEFVIDQL